MKKDDKHKKPLNENAAEKPKTQPAKEKAIEPEAENPFDFGGLPNRNLKKNLGCS